MLYNYEATNKYVFNKAKQYIEKHMYKTSIHSKTLYVISEFLNHLVLCCNIANPMYVKLCG